MNQKLQNLLDKYVSHPALAREVEQLLKEKYEEGYQQGSIYGWIDAMETNTAGPDPVDDLVNYGGSD